MNGPNNKIGWCDFTANPVKGKCPNLEKCKAAGVACYADRLRRRFYADDELSFNASWYDEKIAKRFIKKYNRRPRIFVGSMIDIFADGIDYEWQHNIITICKEHSESIFIFCTQNPEKYYYFNFSRNIFLLATARNQKESQKRIRHLINAGYCGGIGLSLEPLLENIKFTDEDLQYLDWILLGGETGPGARPIHPDWVKSIRDTCKGICPLFFKSWGEFQNGSTIKHKNFTVLNNGEYCEFVSRDVDKLNKKLGQKWHEFNPLIMSKVGKKKSGCLIDGVEYKQFPFTTKDTKND